MIKLFISLPMNGKSEEEIRHARELAVTDARVQIKANYQGVWDDEVNQIEVLDTLFDHFNPGTHPLVYLGEAIKILAQADVAYFGQGWHDARGCRIEHDCAKQYGKHVIYF